MKKLGHFMSSLRGTKERPKDAGDRLWKRIENPKDDRLREVSDLLNTFIPVEALKKADPKEAARVENGYEDELMSALFMFMCCEFTTPELMKSNIGSYAQRGVPMYSFGVPGWTGRVAMMHGTCEERGHAPGPESDRCDDKTNLKEWPRSWQTGQEWLRRRHRFAVEQAKEPEVLLCRWDGIDLMTWVSIHSLPHHSFDIIPGLRLLTMDIDKRVERG
jgi:hypothetical protein